MSKTILDATVAECEARNRLAPATPCSHSVPLQREPLGDHSANFCPTCRAVEAERERCLRIAAAAVEHLLMNSELGFSGTLDEMLESIRSGE